jgi:hypothetical protein
MQHTVAADMDIYNPLVAFAPGNRGVSQAPRHIVRAVMEGTIMTNKALIAGLEPAGAYMRTIPVVLHRQADK